MDNGSRSNLTYIEGRTLRQPNVLIDNSQCGLMKREMFQAIQ